MAVALVVLAGAAAVAGCSAQPPAGKVWTVDTGAWDSSEWCDETPCALDAYATRDFTDEALVPSVLVDGEPVRVHCFVPAPAPQRDPTGRDAHRWYLVTVDDEYRWAPDVALTSEDDLRAEPEGAELARGLRLCHSRVPGR